LKSPKFKDIFGHILSLDTIDQEELGTNNSGHLSPTRYGLLAVTGHPFALAPNAQDTVFTALLTAQDIQDHILFIISLAALTLSIIAFIAFEKTLVMKSAHHWNTDFITSHIQENTDAIPPKIHSAIIFNHSSIPCRSQVTTLVKNLKYHCIISRAHHTTQDSISRATLNTSLIQAHNTVKNTVISSHRVARKSLIQENTASVFACIHQRSVARAAAKSHTAAITNHIGQVNAVNQAAIAGNANHNNHIHAVNATTAVVTKNIFFAISGFAAARSDMRCSIGVTIFTCSVNISNSHHSTTVPFANHHKAASAIQTLSFSVDITQENVVLFASIIPKNNHHSAVAFCIDCFTSSKDICHSDILSLNEAILSPVRSDISFNGLNQTFINCKRSWPVNLPAELTCQNTKARLCNFALLPQDISQSIIILFITSSCAIPNCNIVEVACTKSCDSKGVFAAAFCIS
jgi:hypothetical protein